MPSLPTRQKMTQWLKQEAIRLGFLDIKIAKAERMDEEARRLEGWLSNGHHGDMSYMENHFEKRIDPRELVPGAKSVVVLAYNYYPQDYSPATPKLSRYALGRDYHKVVKKKLKNLFNSMNKEFGEIEGRYFVDSAPVLERDWARRSGLGWVGKNTMLIHRYHGSYFFLSELIINADLIYDSPIDDYCGRCRRCIDACPTEAISEEGYTMDGSKCISYLTIELKENIPEHFKEQMDGWAFGCDICQEVCPWNRFSSQHTEPQFLPKEALINMSDKDWDQLDENRFNEIFEGSPIKRTGYTGLKRNLAFLKPS